MKRIRSRLFVFFVALSSLGGLGVSSLSESMGDIPAAWPRILAYAVIFIGMIGAWSCYPDQIDKRKQFLVVMAAALVTRACFIGAPVSDDVYRYLWEGKLVASGISPYQQPAMHEDFAEYRDGYWEHMNHKDRLTAYPPGAMLLFGILSEVAYSPLTYKYIAVLFDLGCIALMYLLLVSRLLPVRHLLFYALNPVVLFAFAAEAHYDSVFVFFLLGSILALEKKHPKVGWFLLGLTIQIKWISVLLVPFVWHKAPAWRDLKWGIASAVIPGIFFLESGLNLIPAISDFGIKSSFNGPLHTLLSQVLSSQTMVSGLTWFGLAGFLLYAYWRHRKRELVEHANHVLLALLCFSSIVHLWYLTWWLPWWAMNPGLSGLWISFASGLYFLTWEQLAEAGTWGLPGWAVAAQWIPFGLLLLWDNRHAFPFRKKFQAQGYPSTYGVVIPVYDDDRVLEEALASVRAQTHAPAEVLVVDGANCEKTQSLVKAFHAQYMSAPRGRGIQIAHGLKNMKAEVALVLHADTRLRKESGELILTHFFRNPAVVGGALGQRFDREGLSLMIIEALNDWRATLGGTFFGDQVLFFRRDAMEWAGGFPEIPLMEDVESSLRLRAVGPCRFLDCPASCSARNWQSGMFLKRLCTVLKFMVWYRIARILKKEITTKLHQEYYGN